MLHDCCAVLFEQYTSLPSTIVWCIVYRTIDRSPSTEGNEASATMNAFPALLGNHPIPALSANARNRARRLQPPASKQRAARFKRALVLLHMCRRLSTHGPDNGYPVVSGGVGLQEEHLRISSTGTQSKARGNRVYHLSSTLQLSNTIRTTTYIRQHAGRYGWRWRTTTMPSQTHYEHQQRESKPRIASPFPPLLARARSHRKCSREDTQGSPLNQGAAAPRQTRAMDRTVTLVEIHGISIPKSLQQH